MLDTDNRRDASKTRSARLYAWECTKAYTTQENAACRTESVSLTKYYDAYLRLDSLKAALKSRSVLDIVSFLEFVHTAACINQLLLTGKEGMALIADIYL